MKKITDLELDNKRVILRLDLNVPFEANNITDDSRIRKAVPTIKYLLDKNCKVIVLSHFGRIKSEDDKSNYSLKLVAKRLSDILGIDVHFINQCFGEEVKKIVDNIGVSNIVLLENTRFMDYPEKKESKNDFELASFWASLGDVYINDAFGSSHREHSSTAAIAKMLPSAVGFLVDEETTNLNNLINVINRPFTIFMGGAKVEDKLPIIKKLLPKCDYLLLGGGILNSFLKASGIDVLDSLCTSDEMVLKELKELIDNNKGKIIMSNLYEFVNNKILDIDVTPYKEYIFKSKLIFINGTPGLYEKEEYSTGTKMLLEYLKESNADVYVGGGDTAAAVKKFGYEDSYKFISSGGGASLEYVADGTLKALEWIDK